MSLYASIAGFSGMAIGATIGGLIASPFGMTGVGIAIGGTIGGSIGGMTGAALFPDKVDVSHPPPPQPHESRVQFSTFGAAIPIVYESNRLAGNVIYMQPVQKKIDRSRHRQDGVRYYQYVITYTSTFAVAFCEGPIEAIARIWVNGGIFVDFRDPTGPYYPSGSTGLASGNLATSIARQAVYFSTYTGTETQTSDLSLVSILGAAETPSYKSICYIVFKDFPIGEFTGIPKIEIEIDKLYNWIDLSFSDFTENDIGNDITITSTSANIARTAGDVADCWIEKDLTLSGNCKFRFTVNVISIGTMTNSTRNLRLFNFVSNNTPYTLVNFYFDDGPASYDYAIGINVEASSQHYSTATLTRYVELIQDKVNTQFTINIYTDSSFSNLEFTDSKIDSLYGDDITKIEMIDAYNATGIAYQIQVENLKYQVI